MLSGISTFIIWRWCVYRAYEFLPPRQKTHIKNLVDAGILDEIAMYVGADLTNCCVTMEGKFVYGDTEFKLPAGCIPRVRVVDADGRIFVEAVDQNNSKRIYQFTYHQKEPVWKQVENDAIGSLLLDNAQY